MRKGGYVHGSNMILFATDDTTPLGHSKSCKISNKATTKKRSTKEASNDGRWSDSSVSELAVTITSEGFKFTKEGEFGYDEMLVLWESGTPVRLKYAHRGEEKIKYRTGLFIITQLDEDSPADDDTTYSVTFENTGKVETVVVEAGEEASAEG